MPNRLARSTSPYLLQHQHNPVNWFPWGQEAFDEARKRNVPIFLSIGYSTCYWCHVMERESFENADIAGLMNRLFVCIKVDREQRPDIDDIYMAAVQAFTQRGGWPMSVFLEPATLKPFWAGTYFPATPKFTGIPTFPQVLQSLSHAWITQPDDVAGQARELADAVAERVASIPPVAKIGPEQVTAAASQLLKILDRTHGGFGPAPKFPQPVFLDLLHDTRAAAADDDTKAAIDHALRLTLTRMAEGGLFDQVGGGFHRYSVDERWLVPHFEKMLYDNALLAWTFARAFERYEDPLFARTTRRTCEYLIREMTSPEGAFFSAQDAEVNHREGQNYLWTKQQILDTLGASDGAWISSIFGLDLGPNFQDPHHPPTLQEPASNVLFIAPAFSSSIWSDSESIARLDALNAKLLDARSRRDQPSTDTKSITGWNGLAIAGLARAGRALAEPAFIAAAARAADILLARARTNNGRLFRCMSADIAEIDGFLEDYAFFAHGLIELARSVPERRASLLTTSRQLLDTAAELFTDGNGGFFDALADQPDLFIRARSLHDGAVPSGTSVFLNVMLDLAAFDADLSGVASGMFTRAGQGLRAVSGSIAASPLSTANSTRALLRLLTLERGPVAAALAHGPAITPNETIDADTMPVEIFADADQVTLAPGESAALTLRIRIAPGYHITAAVTGNAALEPFRVHVISGEGLRVYADYPEGTPLKSDPAALIYEGEFDLPIVLEREGDWTGTPLIALTFQACTDRACLQPTTVEMDVEINRP